MRLTTTIVLLAACAAAWPAAAQTSSIHIARPSRDMQLSESMLQRLGHRAAPCAPADRFKKNGQFEIAPGSTGAVGEFNVPADRFLRIDEASSQTSDLHQTAGAVGTWTKGRFAWKKLGAATYTGTPSFPYWKYPVPGQAEVPIYADKGALVKMEASRRQDIASPTQVFYLVRGCLLDRLPPMVLGPVRVPR